jgi:hypothetical protein
MSEESLRRFLDRLASDSDLAERLKADPEATLAEYELSATERVALATNDEDGLRRLAGSDTAGFMLRGLQSEICGIRPFEPSVNAIWGTVGTHAPPNANLAFVECCAN